MISKNTNNLKAYVKICKDGWRGYILPELQQVPLSSLANPGFSKESGNSFEKVSSSDTAEVYRYSIKLQDGESVLYLKKYPHRSFVDIIKHLFRPSRANRAFKAGLMLQQHGLQTPEIVAFLKKRSGLFSTEDILITREMQNATALSSVFNINQDTITANPKRQIINELGKTIGRMHAAGISHGDLRSGNVFLSQRSRHPYFIFIDNERTFRYPILPSQLRIKNLVQLNMLRGNLTQTDRMRFLKTYRIAAGIPKKQCKRLARTVLKTTQKRFKRRAKTRMGFSGNSASSHWNFQRSRLGSMDGVFLTDFARANTALQLLQQVNTLMETGIAFKDDISTRVARSTYNGWDIVIKRYNYQGLWHSLRHTIKGSRARKCWRFGHLLTNAKIPCAAPLGMIENRFFGIVRESYIINAFVEGPMLYTVMTSPEYPEEQKQMARKKAEKILVQLAEHAMTHSDMKSVNMLINNGNPVLIDLDSMQQHKIKWYFRYRYQKMVNYFHSRLHGKKKKMQP